MKCFSISGVVIMFSVSQRNKSVFFPGRSCDPMYVSLCQRPLTYTWLLLHKMTCCSQYMKDVWQPVPKKEETHGAFTLQIKLSTPLSVSSCRSVCPAHPISGTDGKFVSAIKQKEEKQKQFLYCFGVSVWSASSFFCKLSENASVGGNIIKCKSWFLIYSH